MNLYLLGLGQNPDRFLNTRSDDGQFQAHRRARSRRIFDPRVCLWPKADTPNGDGRGSFRM